MSMARYAALVCTVAIAPMWESTSLLAVQDTAIVARPALTPEQMEEFLLTARIIDTEELSQGITRPERATLSDGRITHDAQIQTVDEFRPVPGARRGVELTFRDSYRFNIAAYRLARLLDLDSVPMSVERRVQGRRAALTWWVDDVLMDEGGRREKQTAGPDPARTASQIHIQRVFDELIRNIDRNAGNLLWTTDWKMWMIDHTRAFGIGTELLNPRLLERIERGLLEQMRGLTADTLARALGDTVNSWQIDALLARREEIVKVFDRMIAERGEVAILYTLEQR